MKIIEKFYFYIFFQVLDRTLQLRNFSIPYLEYGIFVSIIDEFYALVAYTRGHTLNVGERSVAYRTVD